MWSPSVLLACGPRLLECAFVNYAAFMDDVAVRRFTREGVEASRYEDPHIEPYVLVRRFSTDPAIREVTFPPNARLEVHSHPNDTLYVIQSGEFRVDGEGVYHAGEIRWVRGGAVYGPESGGPDGAVLLIVSLGGPFGLTWADED
jgi:quercetin dioxygenase-like cupin family protein